MSAEHRPPTMAFVVLVVLAIAVIGVHRADAGPVGEVVVAQAPPRFEVHEDAPGAATPMPFHGSPVLLPAGIDRRFADDSVAAPAGDGEDPRSPARTLPATSTPTGSTWRGETSRVGTNRTVPTGEQAGTSASSGAATTASPTTAVGTDRHGSSSASPPVTRPGTGPSRATAHAGASRPDHAGPSRKAPRGLQRSGR